MPTVCVMPVVIEGELNFCSDITCKEYINLKEIKPNEDIFLELKIKNKELISLIPSD